MPTEPSVSRDRVFRFGSFELSEREGELRKSGVRIKLQEQPFRVLVELVANSGNLVSREDLHQKLLHKSVSRPMAKRCSLATLARRKSTR